MTLKLPILSRRAIRGEIAIICALAIVPGDVFAYELLPSASPQTEAYTLLSADQLDSLVAPIALYPDPLLAQVLNASTHPSELRQLDEWLEENGALRGPALANAVARESWDPSVQAMAAFPDLVKNMTENIHWTTDLGNAVLNQESDVMDAVQRMRQRAQDAGYLSSNAQQVIERKVVDNRTIITIEPPIPQTVYVPYYNPSMIWGTPVYPWPQFYYSPRRGAWTGAAIGFGTGVAVGSFWGRGGWGWRPAWGWGRGRTVHRWGPHPARAGFAPRRGRRAGVIGTTGRGNVNRRNINRANRRSVNRGNVHRRSINRGNVNRRNVNRRHVNRGSVNRSSVNRRPAGTSGRNRVRQARAGTANRANRPIGTAGRGNRGNRGGSRNVGSGGRRSGGGQRGGGGGRRR